MILSPPPAKPADLVKSVDAIIFGVAKTTQRNRSLPPPQPNIPIPARVGIGKSV